MFVSIRKLEEHRDYIDECISECAIDSECSRFNAREIIAKQLGLWFECVEKNEWFIVSFMTTEESTQAARIYVKRGLELAAEYEGRVRSRRCAIAMNREDAELALLILALDSTIDLSDPSLASRVNSCGTTFSPLMTVECHIGEHVFDIWDGIDEHYGRQGVLDELRPAA